MFGIGSQKELIERKKGHSQGHNFDESLFCLCLGSIHEIFFGVRALSSVSKRNADFIRLLGQESPVGLKMGQQNSFLFVQNLDE